MSTDHSPVNSEPKETGGVANTRLPFEPPPDFVTLYLQRLGLGSGDGTPPSQPPPPTPDTLKSITVAQLERIPFENLAHHGCVGGRQTLDLKITADKILRRNRGGFCYELNLLLAEFLEALGYGVRRLPATTYVGPGKPGTGPDGYRPHSTHIFLLVKIPGEILRECPPGVQWASKYLVDVAYGEPSLDPLVFELHTEQVTSEGMRSRIVPHSSGTNDAGSPLLETLLEWWVHSEDGGGSWVPRFKWKTEDEETAEDTDEHWSHFQRGLEMVLQPESIFSQKMLCCRLTRERKITLAGLKLKMTGPPRFANVPPVVERELENEEQIRDILEEEFGIPKEVSAGLDLTRTKMAPAGVWHHIGAE